MHYQEFDSFEEMMEVVDAAKLAADAQVNDWQRAIVPGSYYISFEPTMQLIIYNEVIEPEPDEPPVPTNMLLVRGYSVIVPEGELGLAHICKATHIITKKQFELARVLGWPNNKRGLTCVLAIS